MIAFEYIFWLSIAVLFYCYIGYGLLIFLYNNIRVLFRNQKKASITDLPAVTVIISAFNEAVIIDQKIANTMAIDYPAEKIKIIVVTDGSNDGTPDKVKQYAGITLLHRPERQGKTAAINSAMRIAETPVVVFTDANTMLNPECIRKIVVHYNSEKTGAVAGEKKILKNNSHSAVGEAEGIYWQYESFMKQMDAELYTVVGAAGELFSIRAELYREMDETIILDDFVLSMQICLQGYKIEYEPDAFATESPSVSLADEKKRKIRISAGAYQSLGYLRGCLNFFKYPLLAFQFFSRRFLRWTVCPLMLLLLFVGNVTLVLMERDGLYLSFLFAQAVFYVFALAGWLFARSGKRAGLFTVPFYFVFMHYCLVKGFFKFLSGSQSAIWEKSSRETCSNPVNIS